VTAAIGTYEALFELPPMVARRAGRAGVAFGPGETESGEVPVRQMVKAAQFYAAFPAIYVDTVKRR
jgi:hypothetical protein